MYITFVKGGCLFSGALGYGLAIKRLDDNEWGGPISLMMASAGVGVQLGIHKTEMVILIESSRTIRLFESHGQLRLGGEFTIAGGFGLSLKSDAGINRKGISATNSISQSTGLFAGFSLDGTLLVSNYFTNWSYYGRSAHVSDILNGRVPIPDQRRAYVEALVRVLAALLIQVRSEIDEHNAMNARDSDDEDDVYDDDPSVCAPRILPLSSSEFAEEEDNESVDEKNMHSPDDSSGFSSQAAAQGTRQEGRLTQT